MLLTPRSVTNTTLHSGLNLQNNCLEYNESWRERCGTEWGREPQHNPGTELNNSATEHKGATTGIQETTCEGQSVDVKHNVKSRCKVYECIR